jgi:peptide/nickel transport system substrate-binding protein
MARNGVGNLCAAITDRLGRRIAAGEIAPGDPLPTEITLASQLGVSRTTVREAMKRLNGKGMVGGGPRHGMRVQPPAAWNQFDAELLGWRLAAGENADLLDQLYEIRDCLEPRACALAARRATEADRRAIAAHCQVITDPEITEAESDTARRIAADLAFHLAIFAATHNIFFISLSAAIATGLELSFRLSQDRQRISPRELLLHREIADAITAGDAAVAERAMRELLRASRAAIDQAAARGGDALAGAPDSTARRAWVSHGCHPVARPGDRTMKRRAFLAASAAALAAPHLARAAGSTTLKFIPESDVAVLDPIWTTATVTRNHAYLVFDTLYGQDDQYAMQPQMVAGHTVEPDGRLWRLTLREGLMFHDGTPVRAQDVVPSIRRFAARDAFGRALMDATDELTAVSDSVVQFRLKHPFPLLPNALGKTGTVMPCIMPERLAVTDPYKQVTEMVGSGPYRFLADEHVSGSFVAYQHFPLYLPRKDGPTTFTAGPKIPVFDRIEWHVIPDPATATAALTSGEMDWWQNPTPDVLGPIRSSGRMTVEIQDPSGGIGILRFNELFPPFDNPAIRRALLGAINQDEFMEAAVGDDHTLWKDRVGVFSPGTPLASEAGIEVLSGPRDLGRVKAELVSAGYKGEPVVLLNPSDYPSTSALAVVAADVMKKVGFNVDLQTTDWGTVVQRRASRQPPDRGGWNVFFTYLNGTNNLDPASQLGIRGNGDKAWFGWPTAPKLEALRDAWFAAPDLAAQKQICEQIQLQFWQDVPYIPLGAFYQPTAYDRTLKGVRMGFPQFYNITRA